MVWVGVGAVISVLFKKSIHYTNIYSKTKKKNLSILVNTIMNQIIFSPNIYFVLQYFHFIS